MDRPISEDRRRFERTWRLLVPRLRDALQARLPNEILAKIAKYLVRECVVASWVDRLTGLCAPTRRISSLLSCQVDLKKDIYAGYCVVDGVRYVAQLTNAPLMKEWMPHQLVLDSRKESPPDKVIVAKDYFGVRFVRFVREGTSQPPLGDIPGAWWTEVWLEPGSTALELTTDVRFSSSLCRSHSTFSN